MRIENSTITDIPDILKLYDHAISYQQKMDAVHWPEFTVEDIKIEVNALQQWKIVIDQQIACVWLTAFDDPYIWENRNKDPSVYVHRIATNPAFRGHHFVKNIIDWAHVFAKEHQKDFIRMDTAGHNQKLITYYTSCGFTFLGADPLTDTKNLPVHYHNTPVCLFEMKV